MSNSFCQSRTLDASMRNQQIYAEQVDSLYRQTKTLVIAHPLATCLALWSFWSELSLSFKVYWLTSTLVLAAWRYFTFLRYKRSDQRRLFWDNMFALQSILQASIYAIVWVILILQDVPINSALAVIWMTGLSACAVVGYAANLKELFAFFMPIVVPGFIALLVVGGSFNVGLALAVMLYSVVIVRALMPVNRIIKQSVALNVQLSEEIDERSKIQKQLLALSRQDALTGLANRRFFDHQLDAELRRACRSAQAVSLVLIDIDYFKQYNDLYGHQAGDECLQKVAELLSKTFNRGGDFVARYGGEEFAVILPNATYPRAKHLVQALLSALTALQFEHKGSLLPATNTLTLSAGIACNEGHLDITAADLIQQADQALYQAKQAGRNQVM
ncbi:MAG: GGDEF domain-containing protein [Paraglaciecola sp.]|nr:GGDEF domain-containing protein [Paraglaciecola sp.]NCT46582.1 GGDEF domain-containing protein [Paraglaciecola sp.]